LRYQRWEVRWFHTRDARPAGSSGGPFLTAELLALFRSRIQRRGPERQFDAVFCLKYGENRPRRALVQWVNDETVRRSPMGDRLVFRFRTGVFEFGFALRGGNGWANFATLGLWKRLSRKSSQKMSRSRRSHEKPRVFLVRVPASGHCGGPHLADTISKSAGCVFQGIDTGSHRSRQA